MAVDFLRPSLKKKMVTARSGLCGVPTRDKLNFAKPVHKLVILSGTPGT
jgi:hypothetical protein